MRLLATYLGIYFALVLGAVVALWQGGVLAHLPPVAILLVLIVVVAVGVLLALVWRWRPA
jgi:hypothetical protein